MVRARVVETDEGIQGELEVQVYDVMQRTFRDRGWIETHELLGSGINAGLALELGPGPGYLGLEWIKATEGTRLKALDISPDMIALAEHNAREYGLAHRVEYVRGSGHRLPFESGTFDGAFTNGSLHEWADPVSTLRELWRVLAPGGRLFVSDLRRDMARPLFWLMWLFTKPRAIRPGLATSVGAAYTPDELRGLAAQAELQAAEVSSNLIGVTLTAHKAA